MVSVKDAPRTSTTIVIRSDANARITRSRDPYFSLMRRLFQEDATAMRGQKFLMMVEERQKSGNPVKTSEWQDLINDLDVGRASFYSMRNKLLGAGLISNRNNEYRLSSQFSRDLMDLARWWQTAILGENPDDS